MTTNVESQARNEVLMSFYPMFLGWARKYHMKWRGLEFTLEDIQQEVFLGALKASQMMEPNAPRARLTEFFRTAVRFQMNRFLGNAGIIRVPGYLRGRRKREQSPGLYEETRKRVQVKVCETLPDIICSPPTACDELVRHEESQSVIDALGSLTPMEEELIRTRYGLGRKTDTLENIAKPLGITREAVRLRARYAIRKLQKILVEV